MNPYRVLFHPEAKKEFDHLDGSLRKRVLKQIEKLQQHPTLGENLGDKAGMDLTGYRKLYACQKRIRIVYSIHEGKFLVFIIAVGKREDMEVYKKAFRRSAYHR
jgi:mRNA interferase RelE/StbE